MSIDPKELLSRLMKVTHHKVGDKVRTWDTKRQGVVIHVEDGEGPIDGLQVIGVDEGGVTYVAVGGEYEPLEAGDE